MLDPFSGQPTFLCGGELPTASEQRQLVECHQQRLAALARLCQAATQCGFGTDSERDLLVFPEDALSLLESEGGAWAELHTALQYLRKLLPLLSLEIFGFNADAEDPLDDNAGKLWHIGTGMEAWAFRDNQGSVYKFFLPREAQWAGAVFHFVRESDGSFRAEASPESSYRQLLEKLCLINQIGGIPTEVIGITIEGVLVAKQTRGDQLPEGADINKLLATMALKECPSRLLRCDRPNPRLTVINNVVWLVGDLHIRNVVYDATGAARIIDLVAGSLPPACVDMGRTLESSNGFADILDDEL